MSVWRGLNAGRTTGIAAQLARHFKEGRDWDRAFEHYLQAGDNSMTLSAAREAEGHYAQAVALAHVEGTGIEPRALSHYEASNHTRVPRQRSRSPDRLPGCPDWRREGWRPGSDIRYPPVPSMRTLLLTSR